jgi:hypothetical protein
MTPPTVIEEEGDPLERLKIAVDERKGGWKRRHNRPHFSRS